MAKLYWSVCLSMEYIYYIKMRKCCALILYWVYGDKNSLST